MLTLPPVPPVAAQQLNATATATATAERALAANKTPKRQPKATLEQASVRTLLCLTACTQHGCLVAGGGAGRGGGQAQSVVRGWCREPARRPLSGLLHAWPFKLQLVSLCAAGLPA